MQRSDGSFSGDEDGEIDTRFTFCALACVDLLRRAQLDLGDDSQRINQEAAISYIERCRNADGGYGAVPGGESHAGQVFCCVGARAIIGDVKKKGVPSKHETDYPSHPDDAGMNLVPSLSLCGAHPSFSSSPLSPSFTDDQLAGWLAWRQLPKVGGLNGRPQKLEDVCYSWWVVSSLAMLGRLSWIDCPALQDFILRCQDEDDGGIADRPGDASDIFHTLFGIAGLALTGYPGLDSIDARFCMPTRFVVDC